MSSDRVQEIVGYIYHVTNVLSGKGYVGLTTTTVEERWQLHLRLAARSPNPTGLKAAIRRYGSEAFEVREIDAAHSIKELIDKEVAHIANLGTRAPGGYNLTKGGELPSGTPITVNGIAYRTIKAACEAYELPTGLVHSRLNKAGWSIRAAFGLDSPPILHKHSVEVEGNTFASQSEVARHYGVSNRLVWSRLSNGWSVEEALGLEPPPNAFELDGVYYPSRNDAARAHGIKPHLIGSRLKKGWGIRQSFGLQSPPRSFTVGGKLYQTFTDACLDFGVEAAVGQSRLKRGWTREQALNIEAPPNDLSIEVNGVSYSSVSAASRTNGLDEKTVRYRLGAGWSTEQAFEYESPPKRVPIGINITVEGVDYPNLTEAGRAYDINVGTLKSRLKRGWSVEQALSLEPKPKRSSAAAVSVEVEDVVYPSRSDAARAYGVSADKVESRINKNGWSIEEALGLVKRQDYCGPTGVEVFGRSFKSISEAAKFCGLKSATVRARLRSGWDIEQALRNPAQVVASAIVVDCKEYCSVAQAAEAHGVRAKLAHNRIRKGWSVKDAVTIPAKPAQAPIIVGGKAFESFKAAAKHFDLSPQLVRQHLKRGWTTDAAFGLTNHTK